MNSLEMILRDEFIVRTYVYVLTCDDFFLSCLTIPLRQGYIIFVFFSEESVEGASKKDLLHFQFLLFD